ncbi:hypothetical protein Tco_0643021 [Tanacetum coccineum]
MSTTNQQTLAESGIEERPLILEKGIYVPWASRFLDDPKHLGKQIYDLAKDLFTEDKDRNHNPLALVANSYANPSYSHTSPSYSRSPQPYYVTHPRSMHDYDDDYQGEIQGDAQEDKPSTAMMLNTGRITRNQATNAGNGFAQNNVEVNENVQRNPRATSTLGKTNENDFMLMSAYGDDQLEELNASVIMMACIQPTDNEYDAELTYGTKVISEDNSRQVEHDQDAHAQNFASLESLINNVQVEAKNQRIMNNDLKNKNALINRELETYKERVWDFEKKPVQFINYKIGSGNGGVSVVVRGGSGG